MRNVFYILLFTIFVIFSCDSEKKLLNSSNYDLKLEKAISYYKEAKYMKSMTLLESIRSVFKGTTKDEDVQYYYAMCYYNLKDYYSSSHFLQYFTDVYPFSKYNEECSFLAAESDYLNSPKSSLDQFFTNRAIEGLQKFINKYPESDKKPKANELIQNLRDKLEKKAVDNAMLYFKIEYYRAATVSLKNILTEYPDSKNKEESAIAFVKANYLLAENSVKEKKKERYQKTIKECEIFNVQFPTSKFIKESSYIVSDSEKKINLIENK